MDEYEYKVEHLCDDTYQVIRYPFDYYYDAITYESRAMEYQGSLSDCEAYIRLKEGGYM